MLRCYAAMLRGCYTAASQADARARRQQLLLIGRLDLGVGLKEADDAVGLEASLLCPDMPSPHAPLAGICTRNRRHRRRPRCPRRSLQATEKTCRGHVDMVEPHPFGLCLLLSSPNFSQFCGTTAYAVLLSSLILLTPAAWPAPTGSG